MNLILGSSSPYRLQLLKNAGLHPTTIKPDIDESIVKKTLSHRPPLETAQKLAFLKSNNIILNHKLDAPFVVIGSDQICVFNQQILDKPGSFEKNLEHLKILQNNTHSLITCVCLLYKVTNSDIIKKIEFYNQTDLRMKPLSDQQIINYVEQDKPFDCAGGYKFESLGHTLIDKVITDDETSIQGLPMNLLLKHLDDLGARS
jgi:septum formation protein